MCLFLQAIAAEELARAAGTEGMDEDESNVKYEITRKHFEEGLAGERWKSNRRSGNDEYTVPAFKG